MKRILFLATAVVICFSACVKDRVSNATSGPVSIGDRKLIHYWSFNSGSDSTALSIPDTTIGGGHLNFSFAAAGYVDNVNPGSGLNLRRGEDTGSGLRVRNPYYSWVLHAPTTGYKQPIIQFAVQRSNSGPASNTITYTTDGTTYTSAGLNATSVVIAVDWTLYSLDFSSISAVNDNPHFAVKFSNSIADTSGGNNRYDNISVDAFVK